MPSHQIRIQQNNCEHNWWYYTDQLDIEPAKDYKKCIKCNIVVVINK